METWTCLCGTIVDGGLEVYCFPITDLICVALTPKTGGEKLPFAMPRPTVPMANGDLLQHRHHMLTHHLLGLDPALQRVQGLLIATHIREVALEMRRDRETINF